MPDIGTRADCETLVRAFYAQALDDAVIGFLFTDVAQLDLEHHLPRITRFWETVLLGAQTYGGGAFRPHIELNAQVPLRRGHFERWLWLWAQTVDSLFAGPVADEAKRHAVRVATAFHGRLEAINQSGNATPVSTSERDQSVAAAPGSAADLLRVTNFGAPRHSPGPDGPT